MKLYIAVTPDKYELPVHVTDTAREMAKWNNVPIQTIYQAVSRNRHNKHNRKKHLHPRGTYRFYAVEVDNDDE